MHPEMLHKIKYALQKPPYKVVFLYFALLSIKRPRLLLIERSMKMYVEIETEHKCLF